MSDIDAQSSRKKAAKKTSKKVKKKTKKVVRRASVGRGARNKGAQWERDVSAMFVAVGFPEARRGLSQARGGGAEESDVIGVPGWHIECKCQSRAVLAPAWRQATADAPMTSQVLVAVKRNGYPSMGLIAWDSAARIGIETSAEQRDIGSWRDWTDWAAGLVAPFVRIDGELVVVAELWRIVRAIAWSRGGAGK
jgi:hypothetical protein